MNTLRLTLMQIDIIWEDKPINLNTIASSLSDLKGKTDLVVLPEMFTTGFSNNCEKLAETMNGPSIQFLQKEAITNQLALVGSVIIKEGISFFNRCLFIYPNGDIEYYDKKHLFRMSAEAKNFTPGKSNKIISFRGWNIKLQICYDLRFPIWARNKDNEYDLLIYTANWPKVRIDVWNALLKARALENLCYVCGVNRVGEDSNSLIYNGSSALYDAKGRDLSHIPLNKVAIHTLEINKEELEEFRQKFPAWRDADSFLLTE